MGSAIGDYIHLKSQNYLKYGTRKDGNKTYDGQAEGKAVMRHYINERKNFFKNQAQNFKLNSASGSNDIKFLETLKNLINAWDTEESQTGYDKGLAEGVQIVKDLLKEKFGDIAEDVIKMTAKTFSSTMTATTESGQKIEIGSLEKLTVNGLKGSEHYTQTIGNRLESIKNILKFASDKGQMKKEKVTELQKDLNSLEKEFNNLSNEAYYIQQRGSKTLFRNTIKIRNFYGKINELIGKLKGVQGIRKGYVGDAFQLAIAVASQLAAGKTAKEIKKMLLTDLQNKDSKQIWFGGLQTSMTKEVSFAKDIDVSKILGKRVTRTLGQNWTFTTSASQDKVDIGFSFNEGEQRLISAKNYALYGKSTAVHILGDAPLLTLMIAQTNGEFINHFLNIMAEREDQSVQNNVITNMKQVAEMALQIMVLESSLQGYRDMKANTFIINNSTSGAINMMTTADLFNAVASNLNAYLKIEKSGRLINKFIEPQGENDNQTASARRITAVLRSAAECKIKASILSGVFSDPRLVGSTLSIGGNDKD